MVRRPFVKDMIKDIDNSIVLSNQCIQSPVLGQIPPERLSSGVKTCIMLYKLDDFSPDLVVCGENCESWLSKIFRVKDCKVSMSGYDLTFRELAIEGVCIDKSAEGTWENIKDGDMIEGYLDVIVYSYIDKIANDKAFEEAWKGLGW